jgi:hypothetical protein
MDVKMKRNIIQYYGYDSSGNVNDVRYGNASASANLYDGSLHASSSTGIPCGCAIAYANWQETIYFDMLSAIAPQTISFGIHVDGSYGLASGLSSAGGAHLDFGMYNADFEDHNNDVYHNLSALWYQSDGLLHNASDIGVAPQPFGFTESHGGLFDQIGPTTFSGSFTLAPGEIYSIWLYMGLDGGPNFDFGNTAKFSLNSPIPFTSQSGFFLTASPSEVPIPAALPMLASGIGAISLMARRRAKKRSAA